MRTQEEINYYLQDTTIKNARNLLDIELCINNNNLHLPNNVIIHENGISFAEFYKWFENRCLEKIVQKFDISTLKPFDKVLVRDHNYEQWSTAVYSHKQDCHFIASGHFKQCIPYKNNKHLLGTTDDCDDFYKTWK